ncbi:hypothetical protein HAPAU_39500 [Halalkalicoccus paucihalophilus]|uniref:Uncharacterized protein n=1 Tax=Halalkalicoccus paucihalophilus TaxID=1008153 RepID=A0A151A875_9EURY|nr:hypothetical protein [Halalkalicoccus paucihalophilus]KYH23871.1 hypothetical protein HAPAU_39500 [Halalkalicoccus paucihalophilus]
MNIPLNPRRLVVIVLVMGLAMTSIAGPVAAASETTATLDTDGIVLQTDASDLTDDNESDSTTSNGDDDESNVTAEDLEELPIDVDEGDVDLEAINNDSEDNATNTTNGTSAENGSGTPQIGGGGGTGSIGPSLSPEENAKDLAEWLRDQLRGATVYIVDEVINDMLGTPTPENDGWHGILGQPVGDTYSDLYEEVYLQMILPPAFQFMIIGFIFFTLFVVPFSPMTGQRVWSVLLAMFGAGALVMLSWNVASLLHHVSDAVTMWFLPQGEEILASGDPNNPFSEENIKLNAGPLAVGLGVYLASWNVGLMLALIHGIRHAVLFLMPTILPIILVGMYFGPRTSKAAFSVLFWQYIGLLVMNWPTALLLSIGYHVGFDFGMGAAGSLANMAVTIGVIILAVVLPLTIQTSFLGGSLVAIITKGSVLSAGMNTARRVLPSRGDTSRLKRGGGYINPVSRFTRGRSNSKRQQRRDTAAKSTTRSRRGQAATDGGSSTQSRLTNYSQSHSRSTTPRRSGPPRSQRDAGSIDARRRERYRRLRSNSSDSS